MQSGVTDVVSPESLEREGSPPGGFADPFGRSQDFQRIVGEATWGELSKVETENAVRPTQVLIYQGANPMGIFFVLKGTLQVKRTLPTGELQLLRTIRAGDMVGLWSLLATIPYAATVEAVSASRVAFVSRHAFFSLLEADPELPLRLLQAVGRAFVRIPEEGGEGAPAWFL